MVSLTGKKFIASEAHGLVQLQRTLDKLAETGFEPVTLAMTILGGEKIYTIVSKKVDD